MHLRHRLPGLPKTVIPICDAVDSSPSYVANQSEVDMAGRSNKPQGIDYDGMFMEQMRGLVRTIFEKIASEGFTYDHHALVSFKTKHPGVTVPVRQRALYPEDMTVVLQNKFSGLKVSPDAVSVTLEFDGRFSEIVVPFAAMTGYMDRYAEFALALVPSTPAQDGELSIPEVPDFEGNVVSFKAKPRTA